MQLQIFLKKYRYFIALLAVVVIIIATALILIFATVESGWEGVPLQFTGDSYFYYARLKEIFDGHPFIGNPFYIEHNNELAPAFFVADWLAAAPLFLGLSISGTVIFNLFFWSLLFVALFYLILRLSGVSEKLSFIGALLGYAASFSMLARAVSLQTVFPAFLGFLLAMIIWQKYPTNKKATFCVALTMTASVYVYTYLSQIIVVFIPLLLLYLYVKRRRIEAFYLFLACVLAFILSLPFIIYTWRQINSPYFWETMERVGLVYTHLPAFNFVTAGFWAVAMIVLLLLSWRWLPVLRHDGAYVKFLNLFSLSGLAMVITSGSNIITGKESENSQHIERFMIVWLVMTLIIFLSHTLKYRQSFWQMHPIRRVVLTVLFLIAGVGVVVYAREGFSIVSMVRDNRQSVVERQSYAAPLRWLEDNSIEPAVIWTIGADDVNNYVTIMTKHYVFFVPSALTYLLSDAEHAERYLAYHFFDNLEQADIERDFWSYAGVAHAVHQHKVYNRRVRVCRLLLLDKMGYNCGELTDSIAFQGRDFFQNLYNQYVKEIKPNIVQKLQKYQVSYILVDGLYYPNMADNFAMAGINSTLAYRDNRFSIYIIK